jgi:hypothetical protein
LLRLLPQKFGPLPAEVEQAVQDTTDISCLHKWAGKIIPAKSLADIGITARNSKK